MSKIVGKKIVFTVIIAGRKQKEALLKSLSEAGAKCLNVMYGKGSVKSSYIKDVFGLVSEENKVIITCILTGEKSECMFKTLTEDFNFNKSNTGIAFTIPVEGMSF